MTSVSKANQTLVKEVTMKLKEITKEFLDKYEYEEKQIVTNQYILKEIMKDVLNDYLISKEEEEKEKLCVKEFEGKEEFPYIFLILYFYFLIITLFFFYFN